MSKIFVTAKPNAKEEKVEEIDKSHFIVATNQPPVRGLANKAILKLLSGHFSVPISKIRIITGYTSRNKIIEINQD